MIKCPISSYWVIVEIFLNWNPKVRFIPLQHMANATLVIPYFITGRLHLICSLLANLRCLSPPLLELVWLEWEKWLSIFWIFLWNEPYLKCDRAVSFLLLHSTINFRASCNAPIYPPKIYLNWFSIKAQGDMMHMRFWWIFVGRSKTEPHFTTFV